jgi:hypothetical protein
MRPELLHCLRENLIGIETAWSSHRQIIKDLFNYLTTGGKSGCKQVFSM